jgi:hypothetical protein
VDRSERLAGLSATSRSWSASTIFGAHRPRALAVCGCRQLRLHQSHHRFCSHRPGAAAGARLIYTQPAKRSRLHLIAIIAGIVLAMP